LTEGKGKGSNRNPRASEKVVAKPRKSNVTEARILET